MNQKLVNATRSKRWNHQRIGIFYTAGSVLTKDVEPFTVVAGNPAKIIKTLTSDDLGRNDTAHS